MGNSAGVGQDNLALILIFQAREGRSTNEPSRASEKSGEAHEHSSSTIQQNQRFSWIRMVQED